MVALLSVAAGIPKILQMPQELSFLSAIGLSGIAVSILGCIQLAGGIMLFLSKLRLAGAMLAGFALLVSSIAIYFSGNMIFGVVSLLPFIAAVVVLISELKGTERDAS